MAFDQWRRDRDRCHFWGSLLPAFLWGVVVATIVRGIAQENPHEFADPFSPLGGLTTPALFVTHGAVFLALKTRGRIRRNAKGAAVLAVAFLTWAQAAKGSIAGVLLTAVAIGVWGAGMVADLFGREGWAFLGSAAAIGAATISLFAALHPEMPPPGPDIENAASTPKTVQVMTWVAVVFLPLVLVYRSWTYWVFRHRVGVRNIPAGHN